MISRAGVRAILEKLEVEIDEKKDEEKKTGTKFMLIVHFLGMSMTEYSILAESQRFVVAINEETNSFHTIASLEQKSKYSQPYSIP